MIRNAIVTALLGVFVAACETPPTIPERSFRADVGDTMAVIAITESLRPQFGAGAGANRTRSVGTEEIRLTDIRVDPETGQPVTLFFQREREILRDPELATSSYVVTPRAARNFARAGVATTSGAPAAAYGAGGPLDDREWPDIRHVDPETGAVPPLDLGSRSLHFLEITSGSVRYRID